MLHRRLTRLLLMAMVFIGAFYGVRTSSTSGEDALGTKLHNVSLLQTYSDAEQCRSCHLQHFQEWESSFHARSLTSEGFLKGFSGYLASVEGAERNNPETSMACFNCHAPSLKKAGGQAVQQVTDWVLAKDAEKLDGFEVGCIACHEGEAGTGTFYGPIRKPLENPFHKSAYSAAHQTSSVCADCHTWTATSVPCSDVYTDWHNSPAAEQERTCQSCHMPEKEGAAAAGGPMRKIHAHNFAGGRSPEMLARSVRLNLDGEFVGDRLRVVVAVESLVPHRIPDG